MGESAEQLVFKDVFLSEEDLKEPAPAWPSLRRWDLLTRVVVLGTLAAALMVAISSATNEWLMLAASGLFAAALLIGTIIGLERQKHLYRLILSSPSGAAPCDWIVDENGLRQWSSSLRVEFPWSSIVEVMETARSFTFVRSPLANARLPKRYGDEAALERLRQLIDQARARGDIRGFP